MRRIRTKYEEEKKKNRNGWIIGIILIAVMIFSTLGYAFNGGGSNSLNVKFNGFEFQNQNGLWFLEKDNYQFTFLYNPFQTERANSSLNNLEFYKDKPLYIYSKNVEAETEIYRNLFYQNKIVQRFQYACLEGEKCEGNFPIKTCSDNFILIRDSEINGITQNQNCVFVDGAYENLTLLSDEFLFNILEITN